MFKIKLKLFLYRVLKIRHGEERKLGVFTFAYFFLSMAIGFLANILDSIFLGKGKSSEIIGFTSIESTELIPILLVISAIIIIIISLIYSYYTDRLDKRNSLIFVLFLSGFITLIFWILFVIFLNETNNWIILSALYVFRLVITTFFVIQFWEMMNSYFDLREGKRLFPIILIIGTTGYSFASFILVFTTPILGTTNDLLLIVICVILSAYFLYKANIYTSLIPRQRNKKGIFNEVNQVFDIVKKNRFVKFFTLSTLIFGIVAGLILYAYNDIVTSFNLKTDTLTAFLGIWRGSANLIIGLIEAGLIMQIMSQTSMGTNFFLTLIIKIVSFIVFVLFFMLSMVATADFSRQLLQALISPAAVIAFSILPRNVKGKIMNINNGMISQIGILISGAILQLVHFPNSISLLGIILGLIAVRIILNYTINREYLNTLSFNIKKVNITNIYNNIQSIIQDKELFKGLMEQYEEQDIPLKIFILNIIKQYYFYEDYVTEKLKELLVTEKDQQIKLTIINIFYEKEKINISNIILQYLKNETPELCKVATLYMIKFGDKNTQERILQELMTNIKSDNKAKYYFTLSILKEIEEDKRNMFIPQIREKLITGSDEIKNNTVITLAALDDKFSFEIILDLINNDDVRENALKSLIMLGERSINGLISCYNNLMNDEKANSKSLEISYEIINSLTKIKSWEVFNFLKEEFIKCAESLSEILNKKKNYYKEYPEFIKINKLLKAIIKLESGTFSSIRDISLNIAQIYLERAFYFMCLIKYVIEHIKEDDLISLFKKFCYEEIKYCAYSSANAVALAHPKEHKSLLMIDSIKKFGISNKLIRAQAFEAFENYSKTKYGYPIITLLDPSISEKDKFNYLKPRLKNISINFNEIVNYWLSLDKDKAGNFEYKKLIAKKININFKV